MSRYDFAARDGVSVVAIGWDRPLATFFVQVSLETVTGLIDDATVQLWRGTSRGELPTAASAIAIAAPYADLPAAIGAILEMDRLRSLVEVDGPAQQAARPFHVPARPVIRTEAAAREPGYTGAVIADSSLVTLELLVAPDADLDRTFAAFDRDAGEMLDVNGWNFTIAPEAQE